MNNSRKFFPFSPWEISAFFEKISYTKRMDFVILNNRKNRNEKTTTEEKKGN